MDVIIQRADGGLTHLDVQDGADIGTVIDKWEARNEHRPAVGWRLITRDELPPKRFRNAWRLVGGIDGTVVVDLAEARILRRAELERLRETLLTRLREPIEDAEDNGQTVRANNLKAKRRALRSLDLSAKVLEAQDITSLEALVPAEFAD